MSSARAGAGATKALVGADVQAYFDVLAKAGAGGMGVVYEAVHRESQRKVALKLVSSAEGDIERFALECDILLKLDHPGIVRHVAHGVTSSGGPYLAMEWLDGCTLSEELARGKLTVAKTLELGARITEALAAAHANKVVHRDLKPSNIFLVGGDPTRAKILDFGIARLREGHRDLTLTNQIVGTPGYMAPEQARGVRDVDATADLFSLGCVLFHSLTGVPPFNGPDILTVLAKLASEEPPPVGELVDDVPEPLELLIVALLQKNPQARPKGAEAVSEELARIAALIEASPGFRRRRGMSARPSKLECIVLAQPPEPIVQLAADGDDHGISVLQGEIEGLGGQLQVLAGGAVLVRVPERNTPDARAEAAARCADLLARSHPLWRVSIASRLSGTMQIGDHPPAEGVIDHASRTLADAHAGKVRLALAEGDTELQFHRQVLAAIRTIGTPFELAPTIAVPAPRSARPAVSRRGARTTRTAAAAIAGALLGGLIIGVLWLSQPPEEPARPDQSPQLAAPTEASGAGPIPPSTGSPSILPSASAAEVVQPATDATPARSAIARPVLARSAAASAQPAAPTASPTLPPGHPTAVPAREAWE